MTDEPAPAHPPTGHLRVWARSLFALPPAPGPRWPIALQAALSMFVPVALFTVLGHPEVGLQAAGGAFTAIYLAWASPARRVRLLPVIGLALLLCAALGTLVAPFPVAAAVGLVLLSVVAGALHYGYRLGPPGPIFFVLVYGLATHVTSLVHGHRLVEPLPFLAAVTAGAAIAYAIAVVAFLLAPRRTRTGAADAPMPRIPRLGADERALLIRVAIVAIVGTLLSVLLVDAERAYWTVTAGLAVIGVNAGRRVAFIRGSQRLVGTVVGAVLFAALAFIPLPVFLLPFVLGALQFAIEMLVVRNYALALVFITPLVLIITSTAVGATVGVSDQLVWERVLDTLVGATLGAVSGIVHPRADTARRP